MTAAEALAQHQPTQLGDSCRCGVGYSDTTIAAHQVEALKAAGYAVVELPVATPDEYQGEIWRVELSDWTPGEVYIRNSDRRIGVTGVPFVLTTPQDARALAAALLAAAEAAS